MANNASNSPANADLLNRYAFSFWHNEFLVLNRAALTEYRAVALKTSCISFSSTSARLSIGNKSGVADAAGRQFDLTREVQHALYRQHGARDDRRVNLYLVITGTRKG